MRWYEMHVVIVLVHSDSQDPKLQSLCASWWIFLALSCAMRMWAYTRTMPQSLVAPWLEAAGDQGIRRPLERSTADSWSILKSQVMRNHSSLESQVSSHSIFMFFLNVFVHIVPFFLLSRSPELKILELKRIPAVFPEQVVCQTES